MLVNPTDSTYPKSAPDSEFIPLYAFLKKWSMPQHISVCSAKINFPPVIDETRIV